MDVFQELRVDRTLFTLVFGESVLNDAVAIVLYHTLLQFESMPVALSSVLQGILYFVENFVGSLSIGVAIGLLSALLFKHVRIQVSACPFTPPPFLSLIRVMCVCRKTKPVWNEPSSPSCPSWRTWCLKACTSLGWLPSYSRVRGLPARLLAYFMRRLHCAGISMAHYTVRNLTASTRQFSLQLFRVLAMVCEALVFVYIGKPHACPPSTLAGMGYVRPCVLRVCRCGNP